MWICGAKATSFFVKEPSSSLGLVSVLIKRVENGTRLLLSVIKPAPDLLVTKIMISGVVLKLKAKVASLSPLITG